jgi:hypothetical protein
MALFDCKKLKYKHLYRDLQHFFPFSNIDYQEVINSESLGFNILEYDKDPDKNRNSKSSGQCS